MEEQKVLAALIHSRRAYDSLLGFLDSEDFSDAGKIVLSEIGTFYQVDPAAQSVDPGIILERIKRSLANPKQEVIFRDIVGGLKSDLSPDNVALEYLELKRQKAGNDLARAIVGRLDRAQIDSALEQYRLLCNATDLSVEPKEHIDTDLGTLMRSELDQSTKIRLLPGRLNDLIGGGVRRGDCIVVFGRPNSGKSLFCINATSGFLRDGYKVLWIENEDRGNRTLRRIASRLVCVDSSNWFADEQANIARAQELGYGNLVYVPVYPGTITEVEELVREHKPDVLIVNQLRYLKVPGESVTRQLDVGANRLRALGKRSNCVTILVTQCGSFGKDRSGNPIERPILSMDDIDSSHTGIPGAGDLIIGYGITKDLWTNRQAVLNVCKNKFSTFQDFFYCRVIPEIDKLESKANT